MKIYKFDLKAHDIERVAGLIVSAQAGKGEDSDPRNSHGIVVDLIRAGNNFLGHENIYVAATGKDITGVTIGYRGRGKNELGTLLRLLLSLRLGEFVSYLSFTANLLHGGFTPDIEDDEYYISVLAVDERYRRKGIGSSLLDHSIQTARGQACKSVVLDVDRSNEPAIKLYRKFGFIFSGRNAHGNERLPVRPILTMELILP